MDINQLKALATSNEKIELCIVKFNGVTYRYENTTPQEIIKELEKWTSKKI